MIYSKHIIQTKSDNIEIVINDEVNEVIKGIFDSLKNSFQNNLELIKGSKFIFDYVHSLHYKCHKINPNRNGLDISSPDWIEKTTINLTKKKKDVKYFSVSCNSGVKS